VNEQPPENNPNSLLKRFWWAPLAGLPLIVLLMLSLRDFVRDVLALPLSYTLWFIGLIGKSIPQIWFWTGLLAVVLIIAMRSLSRERRPPPTTPPQSTRAPLGRITVWTERISMLLKGKYSRQRFGYFIGKLILDVLSHEERLSLRDVERRLEQGELDLPPAVRDYLFSRLKPGITGTRPSFRVWLKRLLGLEKPLTAQLDAELESIIKFLEDQLEV
jgi:hypothetical protein